MWLPPHTRVLISDTAVGRQVSGQEVGAAASQEGPWELGQGQQPSQKQEAPRPDEASGLPGTYRAPTPGG